MTSFPSTYRRTPSSARTVNVYVPAAIAIDRVHRATKWSALTPGAGEVWNQSWLTSVSCRDTTGVPVGNGGAAPAPGVFQYSASHVVGRAVVAALLSFAVASQAFS